MPLATFHPIVGQWFATRFGEPTEPQALGWPPIQAGRHTLIAAPTGSGKTLAAFLASIDRLLRDGLAGCLADETQVLYVSPLKALSNDIERNLDRPLTEIRAAAAAAGTPVPPIRVLVRTGDTPASHRQSMLRRPPHILVTTPESLYILLTSERGRQMLRTVRTVIVDEIHALARDKRGSHLALSLARLERLCPRPPVRIGLSATQRPIDEIARFLVGSGEAGSPPPEPTIVDVGHLRELDLAVEVPPSALSAVCSHEQWDEIYTALAEQVRAHRSTLIFVNTRKMAERIGHRLGEQLGAEAVASHHGSLSRALRLSAEQRLKSGQLKAIVATASLELGIDVGYIDLVCQIGSPRSIATLLQRVGRAGRALNVVSKGRLLPLTRDELIESLALVHAVGKGRLDAIAIPECPLDILAQQLAAEVASDEAGEDELYALCRRAWPYRHLSRADFEAVLDMLSEGLAPGRRHTTRLHRDRIHRRVRARRGTRLAALTSGGAIPETGDYRVVTGDERTLVGTLNEDFAIESNAGDVFLLGNSSWRIRHVRGGEVVVDDAQGAPATVPFWLGEGPGRTAELSHEVARLRTAIADRLPAGEPLVRLLEGAWARGIDDDAIVAQRGSAPASESSRAMDDASTNNGESATDGESASGFGSTGAPAEVADAIAWLCQSCGASPWAARQAVRYVATQKAAYEPMPTDREIVFERFFDESGGMQLVIHAPLGARINRAWGLALRKRFCRSFDFELQASADDDGIVLSLGPQHSFPIEQLFGMLRRDNAESLLRQALLAVPMFNIRWRWNLNRALVVLRQQGGRRVPPPLQRFRSDDLLSAVFPLQTACLENVTGDIEIPDQPLVRQTVHDCLHEAMDVERWLALLDDVAAGRVKLVARDSREPSPFCYERLNAQPYAFLDDAPLEERRARAVAQRRSLDPSQWSDLARLDAAAIEQVRTEAWPTVRDPDELHEALLELVALGEERGGDWHTWFTSLVAARRATTVILPSGRRWWIAAEHLPSAERLWPEARFDPPLALPEELAVAPESHEAVLSLVRGQLATGGPLTAAEVADAFELRTTAVEAALEALEAEGTVLRGHFSAAGQWCERRLLARIHRLTLAGARRQVEPIAPERFVRFLVEHQHAAPGAQLDFRGGLLEVVNQLQGLDLPAGAWEHDLLPARLSDYDPAWLDDLSAAGEVAWGRLAAPRRSEADGPSRGGLSRVVPISLTLRTDLAWLLPHDRATAPRPPLRSAAQQVLESLDQYGALFSDELLTATGLLPAQLDDALSELAALGLVSADRFAPVRQLVTGRRAARSARKRGHDRNRIHGPNRSRGRDPRAQRTPAGGRWARFPRLLGRPAPESREAPSAVPGEAPSEAPRHVNAAAARAAAAAERQARTERAERWAQQLLHRWGVVFRDLLARESVAPPWPELLPVLRRMEARGEVAGGRFVAGVGGEQFARAETVARLRTLRDAPADERWIALSAADPLNLSGIVTAGPRIPATRSRAIALSDGRLIAALEGGEVTWFVELPVEEKQALARALRTSALYRGRTAAPDARFQPPPDRQPQPQSLPLTSQPHPQPLTSQSQPQPQPQSQSQPQPQSSLQKEPA